MDIRMPWTKIACLKKQNLATIPPNFMNKFSGFGYKFIDLEGNSAA
jgi:hypothetical protein